MFGSIGIPLGLFWFGWTADKGVHWAVPVVAAIPFAWGNLLLFVCELACYFLSLRSGLTEYCRRLQRSIWSTSTVRLLAPPHSLRTASFATHSALCSPCSLCRVSFKIFPPLPCSNARRNVANVRCSVRKARHRLGNKSPRFPLHPHVAHPIRTIQIRPRNPKTKPIPHSRIDSPPFVFPPESAFSFSISSDIIHARHSREG